MNRFNKLKASGQLVLCTRKLEAIIDCAATAPSVKGKAYSDDLVKRTYKDTGFSSGFDCATNIYAVMASSNIPFDTEPVLKKLFLDSIRPCVAEMYATGCISEDLYKKLNFPLDKDCEGNIWKLTSSALALARAQPITTWQALQNRNDTMVRSLEQARTNRVQKLQKARTILSLADECTRLLFEKANLPPTSDIKMIAEIPLDTISKVKATFLEAFVQVRTKKDLLAPWIAPARGTKRKADNNEYCKKTKGKFLIQLVKDLATTDPIAEVPDIPPVEIPKAICRKPKQCFFGNSVRIENFTANNEWCVLASATMKSIECAGLVSNLLSSLDDVNSIASTFSKKVVARLPDFVIPRVPKEREDLHPGRHWHWNSFISKIKRISILSVLSGHVSKNIELRSAHESYLSGKSDSFLLIEGELSLLDGNYICEDEPRSIILRSGGIEQGFANRWKGHE